MFLYIKCTVPWAIPSLADKIGQVLNYYNCVPVEVDVLCVLDSRRHLILVSALHDLDERSCVSFSWGHLGLSYACLVWYTFPSPVYTLHELVCFEGCQAVTRSSFDKQNKKWGIVTETKKKLHVLPDPMHLSSVCQKPWLFSLCIHYFERVYVCFTLLFSSAFLLSFYWLDNLMFLCVRCDDERIKK